MDRRSFIKSIGAAALLPVLPGPSIALAAAPAPAVSAHTYQWAEMIVRAHNKCNLGLLQRSLKINEAAASVLKSQLIENGVVTAQANAYGIHTATKPLYEGAFMNVSETVKEAAETVSKVTEKLSSNANQQEHLTTEEEGVLEPESAEETESDQALAMANEEIDPPVGDDEIPLEG
ncbi:MAG: hypothetical protein AAF478_04055 [Pseudomonadota bacterium]